MVDDEDDDDDDDDVSQPGSSSFGWRGRETPLNNRFPHYPQSKQYHVISVHFQ